MEESQDLAAAITRRLRALQTYSLPQLAGCHSDTALYDELAGDISQNTQIIEGELERLTLIADEVEDDGQRRRILQNSASLGSEFRTLRLQCGKALLAARQRLAGHSANAARQQLLASSANTAASGKEDTAFASADDELMSRTADVTNGLRKTRQLLQQELERSSLSMQILERSTTSLNQTSDHYSSFSSLLDTSKRLITAMEKADVFDRLLLLAALLFFGLVCALIVKRRLVDRGIRAASLFSGVGTRAVRLGQLGYSVLQQKLRLADNDTSPTAKTASVALPAISIVSSAAASMLTGSKSSFISVPAYTQSEAAQSSIESSTAQMTVTSTVSEVEKPLLDLKTLSELNDTFSISHSSYATYAVETFAPEAASIVSIPEEPETKVTSLDVARHEPATVSNSVSPAIDAVDFDENLPILSAESSTGLAANLDRPLTSADASQPSSLTVLDLPSSFSTPLAAASAVVDDVIDIPQEWPQLTLSTPDEGHITHISQKPLTTQQENLAMYTTLSDGDAVEPSPTAIDSEILVAEHAQTDQDDVDLSALPQPMQEPSVDETAEPTPGSSATTITNDADVVEDWLPDPSEPVASLEDTQTGQAGIAHHVYDEL